MKINLEKLSEELEKAGMAKVRVKELVKQIRQDMLDWPDLYEDMQDEGSKSIWALENGFLPGKIKLFGEDFNELTYHKYYSDYDYFMAHPINNHFSIWINDKLTLKYMLNKTGLSQFMPEYYLYIENNGYYTYLMDAPSFLERDSDFIFNLLLKKKHLVLKPNHGASGEGVFILKYEDGIIYKNGSILTLKEYEDFKNQLNGYIVTEFIEQSGAMNRVYKGVDCALRINLFKKIKENREEAAQYDCILAYARFGSDKNSAVSNNDQGGLAVRINWETGKYEGGFRGFPNFWGEKGLKGFKAHPNTGIVLNGEKIPNWDIIKAGLIDICDYLSSLDLLGIDVIVTEDGFKICEINSAPSLGRGQFLYGKCCLDNEDAIRFVEAKCRPYKKSLKECFMAAVEQEKIIEED